MNKTIGACALALAAWGNLNTAHADPLWVNVGQLPGGHFAAHISVSSYDHLMVSASDGYVFQGTWGCSGQYCIQSINWTDTGARNATLISQTLNGFAVVQDNIPALYIYNPYATPGSGVEELWYRQNAMTAPDGSSPCVGSFAMTPMSGTYYGFFFPSGHVSTFWATDCSNTSLWQMNANYYMYNDGSGRLKNAYGSTQWQQLDTGGGDHGLALFTSVAGGVIYQSPWFLSGGSTAYAWDAGGNSVIRVPSPNGAVIHYLTDHYAIGYGANVYAWNGDITGRTIGSGPAWTRVAGQTPDGHLQELAWAPGFPAGAISDDGGPGPADAPAQGSNLWALDDNGNIYYLTQWTPVVPK